MENLDQQLLSGFELFQKGKIHEAMEIAQGILNQSPEDPIAYLLAGNCKFASGNIEGAITEYRNSLRINPTLKDTMIQLAKALRESGHFVEAVGVYKNLWDLDRTNAHVLIAMGELLTKISAWQEAEQALIIALKINPKLSSAHVLLGKIARESNASIINALEHCQRAIEINPRDTAAYTELGVALLRAGDPEQACNAFEKNLEIRTKDNPQGYSNWLFSQQFLDHQSRKERFEKHCGWKNFAMTDWKTLDRVHFNNDPDPKKKLKVGFASADLYTHSVSYFLQGFFKSYDRTQFEFICFSNRNLALEDNMSHNLKGLVDRWEIIEGMTQPEIHAKIIDLKVDILIDLSGHAGKNILPVFLHRAAPVQVTWLGYPDTTGLESIDYRIVDSVTDPKPLADPFATEQLYRLPSPFLSYNNVEDCEILDSESETIPEKIVFGSFNKVTKFSPSVLRLWEEILHRIPHAELLLKCQSFRDKRTRAHVVGNLRQYGIEEDRVKLLGFLPSHTDHMAAYNLMDVALDTFPYNGTTTSCEALWMGVPFITKEGDRHSSRVGMSILKAVGLNDWIAHSDEAYVAKAVEVAKNHEQLVNLKRSLRSRMQNSPLCDNVSFTRKFEAALKEMWQAWCDEKNQEPAQLD